MTMEVVSKHADRGGIHQCIYCLRHLPVGEFNREHVLSKAFGAFRPAPVLHRCVCRQCNQFFADELEIRFARGGFEGMLRYQHRVRPPRDEVLSFRYVDLTIPGESDWSGVRLRLVHEENGLRVSLIPQVAFFDSNNERWVHVTADEMDAGLLTRRPDFRKSQIRIYAPSSEEHDALVLKLKEHSVDFRKEGDLIPPQGLLEAPSVEMDVTFTVNRGIRRCVAKYAFNYLTFVAGSEFVTQPAFDVTRQFVRYGGKPPYPVVIENFRPILHSDFPARRQTNGHLLTVNWARSGLGLIGQVSLFNYLTYSVSLCRGFDGCLWRPIRSGAHFDIESRTVQPLAAISSELIP